MVEVEVENMGLFFPVTRNSIPPDRMRETRSYG